MWRRLLVIPIFGVVCTLGQEKQPTIRVEVKSGEAPVADADVRAASQSGRTGPDGVAILSVALGRIDIAVTKDGFFAARASLDIDAAKEWAVPIELQPQKEREEKVT